jgi:hypothetical protein
MKEKPPKRPISEDRNAVFHEEVIYFSDYL